MVNSYEGLGYGTHVILDGFRADAARLGDRHAVEAALQAIGAEIDAPGKDARLLVRPSDDAMEGLSAVLVGAESHVSLHTFGSLRKLCLEAFSPRTLPIEAITAAFVERFGVGRYECRVYGRGRLLPRGGEALQRALDGDRQYARLRLRDLLAADSPR